MTNFVVHGLFPVPLILVKFKKHNNYKFPNFPKKNKIPDHWTNPLYTSFPNILENDEFIDNNTVKLLKADLKECINSVFSELEMPRNWDFYEFWYNYYYQEQGQEKHAHLSHVGQRNLYWSGIYYNSNPTPTLFHREENIFTSTSSHRDFDSSKLREFYFDSWYPYVEEGDILLFPPCLKHSVSPTNSDNMRLTFSFNITLNE